MTDTVVTVEMDDSLEAVKEIFDNTAFHHLLVVESDRLCGVVSDRDLLKAVSPNIGNAAETSKDIATLHKRVHQIMTRKPVTLKADASVYDAIDIFKSQRISCIPVVDNDDRPVGVVSWRDILKVIDTARGRGSSPAGH